MKKIVLLFLFFSSVSFSQTRGISYQALIIDPITQQLPGVNNSNAPLANKNICLKFSIIDEFSILEYEEIFSITTDNFGMVNLIIGTEVKTGGYASSFEDIQWSLLPKNLKIDLSIENGCFTFTEISNSPFTAVPFALFAVNTVDNPLILENQREIALLKALIRATQIGAGLDADGGYTPEGTTFFINSVTSLKEADIVLDNQVKINENKINANTGSITTNTSNIGINTVNINNNTIDITTKISITDIVDDLITGGTAVPLSAEQGKVLKNLVDSSINILVEDILTSSSTINALSANQGKELKEFTDTNATNITSNDTDIAGNTTNIANNTTDIATNVTDIVTNATNIATNVTDIVGNTTNIATNATDITTNDNDIAANITNITTNTTDITTNVTDITTNATNIANNTTDISTKVDITDIIDDLTTGGIAVPLSAEQGKVLKGLVDSSVSILVEDVLTSSSTINALSANQGKKLKEFSDNNTTDITTNTTDIATNVTDIAGNTTNITINTADVAANVTGIANNVTNIATNVTNIAGNTTDITTNTADIAANVTDIRTNATNIASNDTDIAANTTNITTNTTDIATNVTDIAGNTTNITTNTADIATNVTGIATNAANITSNDIDIAANTTNITTNTADIATNVTGIATNATNITSNDTDIAANTTNITTNTSDIATNTADIATKISRTDIVNDLITGGATVPLSAEQGKVLKGLVDTKVSENAAITAATKTKITYDAKGLVTGGADATTADIAASTDKNYVTDAQAVVIGNTSGTNSGDQTAATITSSATTNIAALTVQTALAELDTEKLALAGGSMTGDINMGANDISNIGNATINGTLDVTGDTSISTLDSSGTTSLATSSGAVNIASSGAITTVKGTLNVDEAVALNLTLDVTGVTNLNNTTQSSSTTTGALVIDGGVGIAKNLNVGGTVDVTGATSMAAISSDGVVTLSDNTSSTSSTTGALKVTGGVGIAENLNVGGTFDVTGAATATTQAVGDSSTKIATTAFVAAGTADNVSGIVAVVNGGTGASTVSAARNNLGLYTGVYSKAVSGAAATTISYGDILPVGITPTTSSMIIFFSNTPGIVILQTVLTDTDLDTVNDSFRVSFNPALSGTLKISFYIAI